MRYGKFRAGGGTVTVNTTAAHGWSATTHPDLRSTSSAMSVNNVTVTVATQRSSLTAAAGHDLFHGGILGAQRALQRREHRHRSGPRYRIVPVEWCTDSALTDCNEYARRRAARRSSVPGVRRFCRTQEEALAHGPQSPSSDHAETTAPADSTSM